MIPTTNDQASWPIKYVYSDTNGITSQISVNMGPWTTNTVPLNSQYTGLYGLEQDVTITATATPMANVPYVVPATVCETIQFASIPLFQFAIFYNMDLEIDRCCYFDHRWSGVVQWRHLVGVNHRHLPEYGFRRRHSHKYRHRSVLHWLYWQRHHPLTPWPASRPPATIE